MTTIAASIGHFFNDDGHVFVTVHGELLDALCGCQAVRVEEAFGKKRFIFKDGSAITVGDGRWYHGFENCFCGRFEGHFQGCNNREPVEVPPPQDVMAPPEPLERADVDVSREVLSSGGVKVPQQDTIPAPPSFTICTFGKINSTIAIEGDRNKARREARALLSTESGISHAWLIDTVGRIVDAYELSTLSGGGTKVKKINPGELGKLKQIELPL